MSDVSVTVEEPKMPRTERGRLGGSQKTQSQVFARKINGAWLAKQRAEATKKDYEKVKELGGSGLSNGVIAERLGLGRSTVQKWRTTEPSWVKEDSESYDVTGVYMNALGAYLYDSTGKGIAIPEPVDSVLEKINGVKDRVEAGEKVRVIVRGNVLQRRVREI